MQSTLGKELIAELGRRGLRGAYFKHDAYQKLKCICTVDEIQTFFDAHGFESVLASGDVRLLADGLEEASADRVPPWWAQLPYIGVVLGGIWIITQMFQRKRRVFPRKLLESAA